jgi:hypothetical protein
LNLSGQRGHCRRGETDADRYGLGAAIAIDTPYRHLVPVLWSPRTSAYVSVRQRTSAYVRIRQHTSAYVGIRQHTSAYVSIHHIGISYRYCGGVSVSICTFVLVKQANFSASYIYISTYIHTQYGYRRRGPSEFVLLY